MNIKPLGILVSLAFLTGGCNKSSTPPATSNAGSQPPPAIQAEPFHGQVYKSLNGTTVLTLVSKDECEWSVAGTILLCKYTKVNDTLRVVSTALGTSQVIYFRFTDQGLQANDGNVLLSPERYDAALARLQREQQKLKQEQQAQQQKELLERQHAEALRASENETLVYYRDFRLSERAENMEGKIGYGHSPLTKSPIFLSLFDTYIGLRFSQTIGQNTYDIAASVSFHRIKRIGDVGEGTQSDSFFIEAAQPIRSDVGEYPSHLMLHFNSEADAQNVHKTLLDVYKTWKQKYPDAVWK